MAADGGLAVAVEIRASFLSSRRFANFVCRRMDNFTILCRLTCDTKDRFVRVGHLDLCVVPFLLSFQRQGPSLQVFFRPRIYLWHTKGQDASRAVAG